jgi:hypothetical protein
MPSFIKSNATWEVATPVHASAVDTYAAWLTELGVADAALGINGDDSSVVFNGVACLSPDTVKMMWGTEGALGLFRKDPAATANTYYTGLVNGYRMYGSASKPGLMIQMLDAAASDRGTFNSRYAISNGVMLLFTRNGYYGNPASNAIDIALRIRQGLVEIVLTNVAAGNPVIVLCTCIEEFNLFVDSIWIASGITGTVQYNVMPFDEILDLGGALLNTGYFHEPDPLPFPIYRHIPSTIGSFDAVFRGNGMITGTVKEKSLPIDAPVIRKVRLHRERDGLAIYETWSDALGNYRFDKINEHETYFVIGFDHTGNYRGVIADKLTPSLAP